MAASLLQPSMLLRVNSVLGAMAGYDHAHPEWRTGILGDVVDDVEVRKRRPLAN